MDINQLLDVVDYGIVHYSNEKTGRRMNILEYFSLTDIDPMQLSKIAVAKKRLVLACHIREFADKYVWHLRELDMSQRLNLFFSIQGHELSADEKLTIRDKIASEGFPLVDGVFDMAARRFVEGGVESISIEQERNNIIKAYNKSRRTTGIIANAQFVKSEAIVLSKQM